MLQNLTNFATLFKNRFFKKSVQDTDLIALGTKDRRYGGGYKPTAIAFEDFKTSVVPYKSLTLSLEQKATEPPDVLVEFDNSLEVAYTINYDAPGVYFIEFDRTLFDSTASYVTMTEITFAAVPSPSFMKAFPVFFNVLAIITFDNTGTPANDIMSGLEPTILDIRIYNNNIV